MRERCIQANHFTDNFFNTTQLLLSRLVCTFSGFKCTYESIRLRLSSIKGITRNRFNTGQIQWNNSTLISLN